MELARNVAEGEQDLLKKENSEALAAIAQSNRLSRVGGFVVRELFIKPGTKIAIGDSQVVFVLGGPSGERDGKAHGGRGGRGRLEKAAAGE